MFILRYHAKEPIQAISHPMKLNLILLNKTVWIFCTVLFVLPRVGLTKSIYRNKYARGIPAYPGVKYGPPRAKNTN